MKDAPKTKLTLVTLTGGLGGNVTGCRSEFTSVTFFIQAPLDKEGRPVIPQSLIDRFVSPPKEA